MLNNMKSTYVPITLTEFLNESKSFTLKRKYGERPPVTVGSMGPVRNQILAYVNENEKVSRNDLRKFIIGLNEGKAKISSASMWMKRNQKFFVTENVNGIVYYKLSDLGRRLAKRIVLPETAPLTESKSMKKYELANVDYKRIKKAYNKFKKEDYSKMELYKAVSKESGCSISDVKKVLSDLKENYEGGCGCGHGTGIKPRRVYEDRCECVNVRDDDDDDDYDMDDYESRFEVEDEEPKFRGFGRNSRFAHADIPEPSDRPIFYHRNEEELEEPESHEFEDETEEPRSYRRKDFTDRRTGRPGIYDEDLDIKDEEDLDIEEALEIKKEKAKRIIESMRKRRAKLLEEETSTQPIEEKKEKEEEVEEPKEEETMEEPKEETEETEETKDDESQEYDEEGKVEITEFVITVDDVEQAIKDLEEKEVIAEKVLDEEGNEVEGQIKVNAEYWDALKGWLEEKGVDIEEMFGGEIETEETEEVPSEEGGEEPSGEEGDEDILSFLNDEGEDEGEETKEEPKEE